MLPERENPPANNAPVKLSCNKLFIMKRTELQDGDDVAATVDDPEEDGLNDEEHVMQTKPNYCSHRKISLNSMWVMKNHLVH